MNEGWI